MRVYYSFYCVLGVIYVAILTGIATGAMGRMPEPSVEIYDWTLPVVAFIASASPFCLGFLAGRQSLNDEKSGKR